MSLSSSPKPLKIIQDRRYEYLASLAQSYQELGFTVKYERFKGILEVYPKGTPAIKAEEGLTIEKWID